jgi:hypothetical protein
MALRITKTGLEAIGIEDVAAAIELSVALFAALLDK